ncbi:hypothetical protein LCGC14_2603420 [marine sediment metagenome]|uniref:Uncharacterized protein n=1 Tax=marine sediment metagenome TaxID=412755 RepID=A0A0F9D0U4_9ZZZZ
MSFPWDEPSNREIAWLEQRGREKEEAEADEPRCECGTLLEGQYNNGEEHDESAECREGRLTDEAYEFGREIGL